MRCATCLVPCALCYVGRDTGKAVHCKHPIHCKHHLSLIMHGKHTLHPILVFSMYFPRLTTMLGPHVWYALGLKRVRSPHFICAWSQTCCAHSPRFRSVSCSSPTTVFFCPGPTNPSFFLSGSRPLRSPGLHPLHSRPARRLTTARGHYEDPSVWGRPLPTAHGPVHGHKVCASTPSCSAAT